ncbi:hypothetical protein BG261_05295 [Floricoccus tropicus]|uniref:Uncharacterized protein n=1 Tax=Floricoccus tropicus TaxID=1859473 RepID=A0A1E8GKM3_9LACT|nr:hypothetical protein [Floricoccus tropicus]OFI48805.1 hypothetical protein BG261_05295 [Floricoccus tropicus]
MNNIMVGIFKGDTLIKSFESLYDALDYADEYIGPAEAFSKEYHFLYVEESKNGLFTWKL